MVTVGLGLGLVFSCRTETKTGPRHYRDPDRRFGTPLLKTSTGSVPVSKQYRFVKPCCLVNTTYLYRAQDSGKVLTFPSAFLIIQSKCRYHISYKSMTFGQSLCQEHIVLVYLDFDVNEDELNFISKFLEKN